MIKELPHYNQISVLLSLIWMRVSNECIALVAQIYVYYIQD